MMHTSPHRKVVTYGCRLCLTKFSFFDSSFLGVRYIQTKERIVYVLEVSPCLLLFSIRVYMRLKLRSNDRKLQSDEIFCIILFFFFRNRKLRHFNRRCCAMNTSHLPELLFSIFLSFYLFLHLSDQQEGAV